MRKLKFVVTNKAANYRILNLEPLGLRYGMDSQESFDLSIEAEIETEITFGDDSENVFVFINGKEVTVSVFQDNEEILNGHNLNFN